MMFDTVQTLLVLTFYIGHQQGRGLMVSKNPETRNAQLAELIERAQTAFERSRRLVQESRKIRAEAQARRFGKFAQNRTDGFDVASPEAGQAADQAAQ